MVPFERDPQLVRAPLGRDLVVVALVTVGCLLPFIGKPVHIDDPLFVWTAQHIATDPWNFYDFAVNWEYRLSPMSQVNQNPPLVSYYLAAIGRLAGWSEPALHLGMLPVALAATCGIYSVARLLCQHPLLATLLAFLTPALLVSSTTLMCDVLMIALWCWAVYWWLLAFRRDRMGWLFLSAALVALAALTKYFAIALLPLLLSYAVLSGQRRLMGWSLAAMLIPLAVLGGYEWLTRELYGQGHLSGAIQYARQLRAQYAALDEQGRIDQQFVRSLLFIGGCVLPIAFFAPLLGPRRWLAGLAALSAAGCVAALVLLKPSEAVESASSYYLHVVLFMFSGSLLLLLIGGECRAWRNADAMLLVLWVLGTMVFAMRYNWTTNARSVLPLVPPLAIIVVRRLESLGRLKPWGPPLKRELHRPTVSWRWLALPLTAAAVVSLIVSWADYAHAAAERDAARQLARVSAAPGLRVWYSCHWGFQYYMQLSHAYPIDVTNCRLEQGDLYVEPADAPASIHFPPQALERHKVLAFKAAPCGSTTSPKRGAGFFSTTIGPLPFSLVSDWVFQFNVFRLPQPIELKLTGG